MGAPHVSVPARLRQVVLVAVLGLLAALLVPGASAHAVAPAASAATSAHAVAERDVHRPGPHDDFPMLPKHCQSIYQQLPLTPCHITTYPHRPTLVVWGDSHAGMYQRPLTKTARNHRVNLVYVTAGGCPPAIAKPKQPTDDGYTQCEARDILVWDWIKKLVAHHRDFKLLLGGFWSGYREGYRKTVGKPNTPHFTDYAKRLINLQHVGTEPLFKRLGRLGVRVDVIGQAGIPGSKEPDCPAGNSPYRCDVPRATALNHAADNRRWMLRNMSYLQGKPRLIDLTPAYCDAKVCHGRVDGVNTWYDDIHLGQKFSYRLNRFFAPTFDDLG